MFQGNLYGILIVKKLFGNVVFYKIEIMLFSVSLIIELELFILNLFNFRLNLLESIDNLSYRVISFGFLLLMIGIIVGVVWVNEVWGLYWSWDLKEIWVLIMWFVFVFYLYLCIIKLW